jgi:ankyrin repeat protein
MSGFINSVIKSISKANIFSLIRQGKYELLIQHLDEYPKDIKLQDENHYTPLTYAYLADIDESGPPETRSNIIQLLVDHGGLNIRNGPIVLPKQHNLNDSTPLTFALVTNDVEMAKDLIQRGANVVDKDSRITTYNNRKLTPLIAAIIFSPDVTEHLLKELTPDEINQKIRNTQEHVSAMKIAFMLNNPEIIMLLIRYGADVKEVDEVTGDTYLHDAINKGFPLELVEALIEKYPAIVNIVNKIRHDIIRTRTFFKKEIPPLADACNMNNSQLIELLLQNGADPNKKFLDPYDHRRTISPLIDAVINVNLPITKLLLTYNTKPIDEINIIQYFGYDQRRESRLFDYFITTAVPNEDHSEQDILNMLYLLLEHGATENFNLDYNNVHTIIYNALIDYPFYLTVEALKLNGIEHQLGVDSQRQLAEHMREDRTDRIPQYWHDNQEKIKYIQKIEGVDYYALKNLFDRERFEPQSYFNEKLEEIYQYIQKKERDKKKNRGRDEITSNSSKKGRTSKGGKMKTTASGKAKTTASGKSKTQRRRMT